MDVNLGGLLKCSASGGEWLQLLGYSDSVREMAASDMIYVERKTFGSNLSAFYFCMGSLGTQPLSKHYLTN